MLIKHYLALSLVLNCLLAMGLFFSFQRESSPQPTLTAAASVPSPTHEVIRPQAPRFHWSDLDSDDYPSYIANLRSVNCPEPTIRAIISAELTELYADKALELQSHGLARAELDHARESLKTEQAEVFNLLFPSLSTPSPHPARAMAGTPNTPPATDNQPVLTPLFYGQPNPSLGLNPAELNAWKNLQKRFTEEVGGQYQNPYDPEYRKRWAKAQDDLDEVLHAQLGDDNYNALVLHRNALGNR